MNIRQTPLYEIARIIDLQPEGETGFCALVGQPPSTQLRTELEVQSAGSLIVLNARDFTPESLATKLLESQTTAILIDGLDAWDNEQFASLDINRSRLETGQFLLFSFDLPALGRFLEHAPNLRSYIGANIFLVVPDPSFMRPEEIETRLSQLRQHYNLTDEQVTARARNGTLPSDPDFAEWLVLIGGGDRVR